MIWRQVLWLSCGHWDCSTFNARWTYACTNATWGRKLLQFAKLACRTLWWQIALPSVINNNNDRLTAFDNGLWPAYPGRPVPEETFTHSHPSGSSCFLYHLSPFAMVHGIRFIQLTCLTVLTYNLFPGLLWSSPWSWTLNFMLHTFFHPVIVIFLQHSY